MEIIKIVLTLHEAEIQEDICIKITRRPGSVQNISRIEGMALARVLSSTLSKETIHTLIHHLNKHQAVRSGRRPEEF